MATLQQEKDLVEKKKEKNKKKNYVSSMFYKHIFF